MIIDLWHFSQLSAESFERERNNNKKKLCCKQSNVCVGDLQDLFMARYLPTNEIDYS